MWSKSKAETLPRHYIIHLVGWGRLKSKREQLRGTVQNCHESHFFLWTAQFNLCTRYLLIPLSIPLSDTHSSCWLTFVKSLHHPVAGSIPTAGIEISPFLFLRYWSGSFSHLCLESTNLSIPQHFLAMPYIKYNYPPVYGRCLCGLFVSMIESIGIWGAGSKLP